MANHALVFGASGILGWAVVNELLNNYPAKGTYSKVTALTNRPLTLEGALWPKSDEDSPKLEIISGIDLTQGTTEEVKEIFKSKISSIETVTHVFYFGELNSVNCTALKLTCAFSSISVPPRLPD